MLAALAAGICFALVGAGPVAARELSTSIDLDYSYSQENVGGDVNATTAYNQKYEVKYETSLTTAHDFLGAVRVDLQDSWYTDQASTSRLAPTLELSTKGAQLAAKITYETGVSTTDAYHETGEVTSSATNIAFNMELTPMIWPEVRLKLQRQTSYQAYATESTGKSFEFSMRKDIYGVRLEYNLKRDELENALPERSGTGDTAWSAKAAYRTILWGDTEFDIAYELNESYKDGQTRGVFTGDSQSYNQVLRTRFKNSLVIGPRMTLGLAWEYQFDQDLLALSYDYKLKNRYLLDLRWDAFDTLRITSEARRETDLTAALEGVEDDRSLTDSFNAGFDLSEIPWMLISGKAELKREEKVQPLTGGSVDKLEEEKYELLAKNRIGDFWDFTWGITGSAKHTNDWLSNRETRIKADLKLKWWDLIVTPGYEVARINDWDRLKEYPLSQQQVREMRIKFEYRLQLVNLLQAAFSHQYNVKVSDELDEVLNFSRQVQFSESTRLSITMAELIRNVRLAGEVERRASDVDDDADPQLVELSYGLKLDWKIEDLSLTSTFRYNDKGDTFDDVSFNANATWRRDRLELTGDYQFDKLIKEVTEPMEERRKLNLKLRYKF